MFIIELVKGIKFYLKANRVISKYKLWPYLTYSGILSVCYIILLISLGSLYLGDFSSYINENFVPGFLQGDIMEVVLSIFLWIFMLLIGYISYKEVVLIFFSPVLGYLSERVEKLIYNEEPPPFNAKNLLADIRRGLALELKNLARMLILSLISWLLVFIPIIGTIISPILILLIQSYYGGLRFVDYTLERKRYSIEESLYFAGGNKARITGVGLGFMLILMVPILGWFVAPGYGTIAATLCALEKINKDDPELLAL